MTRGVLPANRLGATAVEATTRQRPRSSGRAAWSPMSRRLRRPDLVHKSPSECEKAGRSWNGASGTCM